MPPHHWDWSIPVPLSQGWRVGDLVFVGGQVALDEQGDVIGRGDIEVQTRAVFEYITKILHEAGAGWNDVVKLNTYYDFSASGDELRKYWERMTKVRLEYLPNRGPAGTALRVGLGYPGLLIEVDAIAVIDGAATRRSRIMPRHHWDWPVPVPLSQGWRVGNLVFVGGQVSQDERGNVIGPGDIEVQTRTTFQNIGRVLRDAGAEWKDVVKLNTYYDFAGQGGDLLRHWEKMTKVRLEFLPDPGPVGTAVRTGLAVSGLMIEADAIAVVENASTGRQRTRIMPQQHWDWSIPVPLSQGWRVGDLVFVGGQVALDERGNIVGPGDIEVQTRTVFEYITRILREAGAEWNDVVKLNTYYDFTGSGDDLRKYWERMTKVRLEFLPNPGPVGTAVRTGLGAAGLMIEVDAIAVVDQCPLTSPLPAIAPPVPECG
jgi:enamine deaminase RidA (YjgF/YER057c/UK114 family)